MTNHKKSLSQHLKKVKLPRCQPPFWAKGGHLQTLAGALILSESLEDRGEEVIFDLEGGDRTLGFFHQGRSSDVVVCLFHGLGGSAESGYIHRMTRVCLARGWSVFRFNHRGCGQAQGLAKQPYHSGRGEDLSATVALVRQRYKPKQVVAVGFSLSGNALLLLATGARGEHKPDKAIAVNAPINLGRAAEVMDQGFNRVYDINFVLACKREVARRKRKGLDNTEYDFKWLGTLRDFDDAYTAPAGGFEDRYDYYNTCSAAQYLPQIQIPTLLLTAEDDPFVKPDDYRQIAPHPKLHLHLEKTGGHMGYFHQRDTPLGNRRWMDYALDRYLEVLVAL